MWWRRCASPRDRLDRERRAGQGTVRAVHAALRRRLLVLLDSHGFSYRGSCRCALDCATRVQFFAFLSRRRFSPASAANADAAPLRSPAPPRQRRCRARGTLAARRKRQRQQQFVLDQRQRVRAARPPARPRARGLRRRAAPARARRAPAAAACAARPATRTAAGSAGRSSGTTPSRPISSAGRPSASAVPAIRYDTSARAAFRGQPIGRRAAATRRRPSPATLAPPRATSKASNVPPRRPAGPCRPAMPASVAARCHFACRTLRHRRTTTPPAGRSKTLDNSAIAGSCQKCPQKQQPTRARRTLARRRRGALVLASTSRYRRDAARPARPAFVAVAPGTDEDAAAGEAPAATALRLAEAKARSVARAYPDALIIGSDQVADCDGARRRQAGQPRARGRAAHASSPAGPSSSTRDSRCSTRRPGECQTALVDVRSTFRDLSAAEIEAYLRREQPYDCAGSVRSEALGIALFARIESDDPDGADRPAADPADRACCARRGRLRAWHALRPATPASRSPVPRAESARRRRAGTRAARAHDRRGPPPRPLRRRERQAGARLPASRWHRRLPLQQIGIVELGDAPDPAALRATARARARGPRSRDCCPTPAVRGSPIPARCWSPRRIARGSPSCRWSVRRRSCSR